MRTQNQSKKLVRIRGQMVWRIKSSFKITCGLVIK